MCVLVTQLCLTICNPMDCSPPGSSVHGDSPGKNTGVGCHAFPKGIEPGSPALQADSLPAELPGEPIITQNANKSNVPKLMNGYILRNN